MVVKSILAGLLTAALACAPAHAAEKKPAPKPAAKSKKPATAKGLDIYFIDVEGGQATLFVAPTGESMLVDTGFPGVRDAQRILNTATQAGVRQIDYLVITHYHGDHVGGVTELAKRMSIGTFVDHGDNTESSTQAMYDAYTGARGKAKRLTPKPGDKLPIKGIDVQFVAVGTKTITAPLKGITGGGVPNAFCGDFTPRDEAKDPLLGGENAQSVAMIISLGKFRMADFGDLTWNYEHALACPQNLVGKVDLYLTTHHGQEISGMPMLVRAMQPRAVVMNNGSKKGGAPETFERIANLPGHPDLWQLHVSAAAGEANAPEANIANLDDTTAYDLRVAARANGSFVISNSRNDNRNTYGVRK